MKMLKKKMKGVGFSPAAGVSSMEKPPPYPVVDDSRTRLRHQSLLQDYDELLKVFSLLGLVICLFGWNLIRSVVF